MYLNCRGRNADFNCNCSFVSTIYIQTCIIICANINLEFNDRQLGVPTDDAPIDIAPLPLVKRYCRSRNKDSC